MTKLIVVGAVLLVVALFEAAWAVRLSRTHASTWAQAEEHHALIGLVLVAPGSLAFGIANGALAGVGGFFFWGALAAVVYGAARLDIREQDELDIENRWLIDLTCLVFVASTVYFSLVSLGSVFIPAACFLLAAARFAHLRRRLASKTGAEPNSGS